MNKDYKDIDDDLEFLYDDVAKSDSKNTLDNDAIVKTSTEKFTPDSKKPENKTTTQSQYKEGSKHGYGSFTDDDKSQTNQNTDVAEFINENGKWVRNPKYVGKGGKGSRKSRKTAKKRKGNHWTRLVTKTYRKNKKSNKNYSFKQAIMDAKKIYKKGGNEEMQE